ncbi:50S ribosomal protein L22 [Candidatus Dojkabacteria bacterium]|uniref:Large ribosomal subunit protein uL22 n=1 Tax=Candidatus Dojkabacteria bacterium TaxID=2099670 RepID=A0A955L965_9BACT|nr:50S ribosomal protein L22 [Candidatus Dojkabacteria bacterium]
MNTTKKVYAKYKNARISPRKARLIMNLLRGEKIEGVSDKLALLNKKAADLIKKVVDSAVANAVNNSDMELSKLYIEEARVDEGFTMKRGKPVSKGRYHQILRRNSHLIIGLAERE